MSRVQRTREQWQALIAEFEHSNQSQRKFCKSRGISPAYFGQRRLRFLREAEEYDSGFALAVPQSPATQQTLQLRVGQTELVLPLSVSPRWVAQLVKELSA